ncbi:MAG: peptide chain release factor 2 [Firmicutes bacterium]|nr:peptide chain release factor 2 [Bacillota bacterium]
MRLKACGGKLRKWGFIFDVPHREAQIEEYEGIMAKADFWDDPEAAQALIKKFNTTKGPLTQWQKLQSALEDLSVLLELGAAEKDEATILEVKAELSSLWETVEALELTSLLDGAHDTNDAYLTIHSGAGGTESQDWAEMLLRMYTRWVEERGFAGEIIDHTPGDEAGIKSATILVKGENAHGYLRAEKGVHRLVRISPFDASGRRHTSFASVDVIPYVEDDGEIAIEPADLRIDTYRASGAGGQHVNKTDSAVRITHIPTGIVVQCQGERSQHSNRERAMQLLRARLLEKKLAEQEAMMEELRGEQREIAWGSQIRSYVFCPYTMVKDHRTDYETGNVQAVMDGELDSFIESYLRWSKRSPRS